MAKKVKETVQVGIPKDLLDEAIKDALTDSCFAATITDLLSAELMRKDSELRKIAITAAKQGCRYQVEAFDLRAILSKHLVSVFDEVARQVVAEQRSKIEDYARSLVKA